MERGELGARLGAYTVVAVLLLMMFQWAPEQRLAGTSYRYQFVGPMPESFAFATFDTETGEPLFALAMRFCPASFAPKPASSGSLHASAVRIVSYAQPATLAGEGLQRMQDSVDKAYTYYCSASTETGREHIEGVMSVSAETARHPWLPEATMWGKWIAGIRIPQSALGASHLRPHEVSVVGDAFDVQVWSGVGTRGRPCAAVFEAIPGRSVGWGDGGGGWSPYSSNYSSDRVLLMCITLRYVGSPAAPGGPAGPFQAQ